MTVCALHDSGAIELYFYGELDEVERARVADHLRSCPQCAEMLGELKMIRAALATRPDISAPPSGEWSAFMARLDAATRTAGDRGQVIAFASPPEAGKAAPAVTGFGLGRGFRRPDRRFAGLLTMAALLALVALSVFVASRAGRSLVAPAGSVPEIAGSVGSPGEKEVPVREGLATVGMRHLERSKLVVLGLANKDGEASTPADWEYERELATGLLNDTRLYRLAAEQRGLNSLASVMKDLELVLLQASMAEGTDQRALPQIQRLIQKRGLVHKMDVVATTGLVP
jgi:hypothetical protein